MADRGTLVFTSPQASRLLGSASLLAMVRQYGCLKGCCRGPRVVMRSKRSTFYRPEDVIEWGIQHGYREAKGDG